VVGNVFLLADGVDLGDASADFVYEQGYWDEIDRAADLLAEYGDRIRLPEDVAVERDGDRFEISAADLPLEEGEAAMDVGTATVEAYGEVVAGSGTVVLNGPAGVFEDETFADGTRELFEIATDAEYGVVGGGAALAMLTGETLPAVDVLRE